MHAGFAGNFAGDCAHDCARDCDCTIHSPLWCAGKQGKLLIPDSEVAKVLKTKTLGPTGMKGLAAIKNIVEKWSVLCTVNLLYCHPCYFWP